MPGPRHRAKTPVARLRTDRAAQDKTPPKPQRFCRVVVLEKRMILGWTGNPAKNDLFSMFSYFSHS